MAKKISRKKLLKEPDQFITFTGKMISFAREYQKQLTIGVASFFALVFIIVGVRYYVDYSRNKAFSELGKITSEITTLAQNNADPADIYSSISDKFKTFLNDYSGSKAAKIGRVDFASLALKADDAETAISYYKEALDDTEDGDKLKPVILESLATAYEQKGDLDAAIQYNEKLLETGYGMLKDQANYNLGRLYEAKGETAKSAEYFDAVGETFYKADLIKAKTAG